MQMSFQTTDSKPGRRARKSAGVLSLNILLAVFPGEFSRADTYASAWAPAQKSSVRLIAAPSPDPQGAWRGAVELRLSPGALTYWRMPGAAGVPPDFSFEGSENIAKVDVFFPVPMRIDEAGTEVFGFLDRVTFPLRVAPREPQNASTLSLTLTYAVCDRICLPAKARIGLALPARTDPPVAADASIDAEITRAEARVPRHLSSEERDRLVTVAAEAGTELPTWRLSLRQGTAEDLFAEGPEGWYFETRKAPDARDFSIVLAEAPKDARRSKVPVTLTLREPDRSSEFVVDLDIAAAGR